jgi:hypothetical protein
MEEQEEEDYKHHQVKNQQDGEPAEHGGIAVAEVSSAVVTAHVDEEKTLENE